jgi:DNA-binding transcriptional regulator GbsR (MarR family)
MLTSLRSSLSSMIDILNMSECEASMAVEQGLWIEQGLRKKKVQGRRRQWWRSELGFGKWTLFYSFWENGILTDRETARWKLRRSQLEF